MYVYMNVRTYLLESLSASNVADVTTTLREGRREQAVLTKPNKISVLRDLLFHGFYHNYGYNRYGYEKYGYAKYGNNQ